MNLRRYPLVLLLVLAACEDRAERPQLSQPLLAALAQARSYHHLADLHLANGAPERAVEALERLLAVPFPAGAPEGEDALLDARARLAKLHLAQGRPEAARRVVDEGLAGNPRESFFLANLYSVSGELAEARAHALDAVDPEAARAERRAAILAHERSIQINERIQRRLTEERN
jgi:tetratricopeptide (TPR) repeat protein